MSDKENTDKMDEAARVAYSELSDIPPEAVKAVTAWWTKHYMSAGHKRLGKALLEHGKRNRG